MRGPVYRFLVDAFLKPLTAGVFFLGFGGFFVFGGFQSVQVDLNRGIGNTVNGKITRSHFFGLYSVSTEVEGITEATIATRHIRTSSSNLATLLVSGLVLNSKSGSTPVFWGFSNVDETYKGRIKSTLNHYIRNADSNSFQETFVTRNLFGWFGLPFFLIGIFAALSWPVTIVACWRRHYGSGGGAA
jgi:hypothetical protein